MSSDDTIAEMRRHMEAERAHEIYKATLNMATEQIKSFLTDEQIKTWQLVDTMVVTAAKTVQVSEDHLREKLMEIGNQEIITR
jgi:cation transport regulator ChaB